MERINDEKTRRESSLDSVRANVSITPVTKSRNESDTTSHCKTIISAIIGGNVRTNGLIEEHRESVEGMLESKCEIIDYDPETGTFRTTYSYPSEPPSIAVPLAIQAMTERGVTDLEPMHDAADVDPDALDDVFRPTASGDHREADVRFTYHGYEVTVKGYGRIVFQPSETR